jgi:hypothetical protein
MTSQTSLIEVAFRDQTLVLVDHNDEPYVAVRPISDGMGLDWASQYVKLTSSPRFKVQLITTPSAGGSQETLCIPLRKLVGWLYGVNANKVRAAIREGVLAFQDECDEVLWNHWKERLNLHVHMLPKNQEVENIKFFNRLWPRYIQDGAIYIPTKEFAAAAELRDAQGGWIYPCFVRPLERRAKIKIDTPSGVAIESEEFSALLRDVQKTGPAPTSRQAGALGATMYHYGEASKRALVMKSKVINVQGTKLMSKEA